MPENDIYESDSELETVAESVSDTADDGEQLTLSLPSEEESLPLDSAESDDADSTTVTDDDAPYDPEKPRRIDSRFEFVELLVLTLAAVFIITTFFFRHSIVDGNSMLNTLHHGDGLIISDLFYTPKQYDIVVIEDHSTGLDHPLVKRVIAVGGDKVKVTRDAIYVNGERVRDDFVFIDPSSNYHYTPDEFVVPEGQVYVLGDHRNDSMDSEDFGPVSADAIIGKVLFRFYPFSDFGSVYTEVDE